MRQTPLQQYELVVHVRPGECVPASGAQHVLLFVLQLLLQQSELRLHWSPIFGQQPPSQRPPPPELLPELPPRPPELLLVVADGGLLQALELSR
jgi:hypothetical protein